MRTCFVCLGRHCFGSPAQSESVWSLLHKNLALLPLSSASHINTLFLCPQQINMLPFLTLLLSPSSNHPPSLSEAASCLEPACCPLGNREDLPPVLVAPYSLTTLAFVPSFIPQLSLAPLGSPRDFCLQLPAAAPSPISFSFLSELLLAPHLMFLRGTTFPVSYRVFQSHFYPKSVLGFLHMKTPIRLCHAY